MSLRHNSGSRGCEGQHSYHAHEETRLPKEKVNFNYEARTGARIHRRDLHAPYELCGSHNGSSCVGISLDSFFAKRREFSKLRKLT